MVAEITIGPTAVVTVAGNTITGTAGNVALPAGVFVYKSAADDLYYLADCDATAVAANAQADNVVGITLCSAGAGQPVKIQTSGSVTTDAVFTVGLVLYLSNVAGESTSTWTDINSTDWLTTLGLASATTVIELDFHRTSIQKT